MASEWHKANKNKIAKRRKKYRASKEYRVKEKEFRKKYKWKIDSRKALNHAVESGKIIPPSRCSECGSADKIEAHHHNGYAPSSWLDVVWLCKTCHAKAHRLY